MSGLEELHHHVADAELAQGDAEPGPSLRGAVPEEFQEGISGFNSDEEAARYFLDAILQTDQRAPMRSVLAPESPRMVPDLELLDARDSPATNTKLVRFTQSHESIPVYGARAFVELTPERDYVSVGCHFADVSKVSSVPSLSPEEALERVAAHTNTALDQEQLPPSTLRWFFDDNGQSWHLAWLLQSVPAAPPEVLGPEPHQPTHGLDPSPRDESRVDYLVDAHDGSILFYCSVQPTLAAPIPTVCRGIDEDGDAHEFYGCINGASYEMNDPLRNTKTYDLTFQDLRLAPLPDAPITMPKNDWGTDSRAAVSAHVNARRVHDFYNDVLQRNGIDDARMELVSVVNVTYGAAPGTRVWRNAVWHNGKMWYGQTAAASGAFTSLSRELDIIAHELTHGVIDHSSQLVYQDESGALNESFCDIIGVIVKNWYEAPDKEAVTGWNWEIGSDFRGPGQPLRDLQDPGRTNMPDHYSNRYVGPQDYGGVHTNSNIHNKAAYNLLTAIDTANDPMFSVRDAATLYYLCLVRLSPRATFREARQVLIDVAKTYYAGDTDIRDRKIAAIDSAYAAVGIP